MGEAEAKVMIFPHNGGVFFKENMLSCSSYSGCDLASLLKVPVDGGRQQHDLLDLSRAGMWLTDNWDVPGGPNPV